MVIFNGRHSKDFIFFLVSVIDSLVSITICKFGTEGYSISDGYLSNSKSAPMLMEQQGPNAFKLGQNRDYILWLNWFRSYYFKLFI